MKGGFIAISRAAWDHYAFKDEPMSMREAWFWMLAQAAWKPTKIRTPHGIVELQRGQFTHSLRHMAKTFGWSVGRVRRVLDGYSSEHMLVLETDTAVNTAQCVVTICNYDKYQGGETATDTATDTAVDRKPAHEPAQIRTSKQITISSNDDIGASASAHAQKLTPRQELETVLDEERADAVIEHRQRMRKPLTARAAKMLAGKLSKAGDPNRAADLMIERGWAGFEVDWMRRTFCNDPPSKAKPNIWDDAFKLSGPLTIDADPLP
jgi:hypothetical protein